MTEIRLNRRRHVAAMTVQIESDIGGEEMTQETELLPNFTLVLSCLEDAELALEEAMYEIPQGDEFLRDIAELLQLIHCAKAVAKRRSNDKRN